MRFLLSYCRQHFDPGMPPEEQKHWGASANIISRTLHDLLGSRGEVTYVDAATPERVAGLSFDAFLGIQRNFGKFLELCEIEQSVLVAVNMHPAEHNALLLNFVVGEGLSFAALQDADVLDVQERTRDIDAADVILLFGNAVTLNGYLAHRVPQEKVRLVNYGSDLRRSRSRPVRLDQETHLLYCASEVGLRKGFDILEGALEPLDLEVLGAHLHIVGSATYPHYQRKLKGLQERLGHRLSVHGWLPPASSEYRDLQERADFLIFPSLEEGQAGTVLDAISCGVIPLISRHSGIDFAPLGFCDLEIRSARNSELVRYACELPSAERQRLSRETLEYYDEFHSGFEGQLEQALDELVDGSPSAHLNALVPMDGVSETELLPAVRHRARRSYLLARRRWLNGKPLRRVSGDARRRLLPDRGGAVDIGGSHR